MGKQEIGSFYAVTFDDRVYEFIVYNDGTMDCPAINATEIYRMKLKPRFKIFSNNIKSFNPARTGIIDDLIKNFMIDDELFAYLKKQNMIMYSTDMAYLYGFNEKRGFDREFKEGHPFKWAEKKGPILVKARNGQFN